MKRGDESSIENLKNKIESDVFNINHLIKVLGNHIEKLDKAHRKKDHLQFNLLKKGILQIQRRIHSLIK